MTTTKPDVDKCGVIRERFDAVVASWHERPRCTRINLDGSRCRRSAAWKVNFHGCSHCLLCSQHFNAWRRVLTWLPGMTSGQGEPCNVCGRVFHRADDVYTATTI
jgi:hypothetical protein